MELLTEAVLQPQSGTELAHPYRCTVVFGGTNLETILEAEPRFVGLWRFDTRRKGLPS